MSPRIIESYICAKCFIQTTCEDGLFIGDNVIAVIDGATSKSNYRWNGVTGGRYAMEILVSSLLGDPPVDSPLSFFTALNTKLKNATQEQFELSLEDYPRASVIAYIASRHEIWSYGDCRCLVGKEYYSHEKIIDKVLGNKRAAVIEQWCTDPDAERSLRKWDLGREAILDDLKHQMEYENVHSIVNGVDYGYPVLNGDRICEDMIAVHPVPEKTMVVLASDGYPILKETLSESEKELARLLDTDPFCYKEYKSTKGLREGCTSFDDRTYIRFEV
jgi:hypothetical protein